MAGAIRAGGTSPAKATSVLDAGTAAASWATVVTIVVLAGSAMSVGPGDRGFPIDPTAPGWLWATEALAAGSLLAGCWLARRPRSGVAAGLALISTGVLVRWRLGGPGCHPLPARRTG